MEQRGDGSRPDGKADGSTVRERMVAGTVRLLATKGVEGTSFAEVLAATGSPRGSVYYHFPGGKPELLHAALDLAGERGLAVMEATRGEPAVAVVERFLSLWRQLLEYSNLTAGCAVVAVTVAAGDDGLLDHAGAVFRAWTGSAHRPVRGWRAGPGTGAAPGGDGPLRHRGRGRPVPGRTKHGTLRGRRDRPPYAGRRQQLTTPEPEDICGRSAPPIRVMSLAGLGAMLVLPGLRAGQDDDAPSTKSGVDETVRQGSETDVKLLELKEKTALSREEAAARLHAIADELASGNDVVIERMDVRFVAHVPDQVHLKWNSRSRTTAPSSKSS